MLGANHMDEINAMVTSSNLISEMAEQVAMTPKWHLRGLHADNTRVRTGSNQRLLKIKEMKKL